MPEHTLRLGIIGGGIDSAIGRSHHIACQMDGRFKIVAGCFGPVADVNLATAKLLDVPQDRLYSNWKELLSAEANSLDAVLLLTPTPMHAEMAIEALRVRIPVISEKALATSSAEAETIRAARERFDGFVAVTYNYSGYPIIRELRHMIASGEFGRVTHVAAEMPQEGFIRKVGPASDLPQPQSWRLADNGIPMVSLDLGVHVHHLIQFLTGQKPLEVCAMEQRQGHFEGIVDSVQCLARYTDDLPVQLWFGKVYLGHANGLRIRVFGTERSAEWTQMNPEYLTLHDSHGHTSQLTNASNEAKVCNQARYARFKPGHPAGFFEAFANYYFDIADWLIRFRAGERGDAPMVANVEIATEGLQMMEAISVSARSHSWKKVGG
jgi:predicted dehydrogenase